MGPITQGKDFNYFKRITINNTAFTVDSNIDFTFRGNISFSLINEGTDTIVYSFNGNTVHGDMVPGTPSASLIFNNRGINRVWLKGTSGVATNVRVEATATGTMTGASGSGSLTIAGTPNVSIVSPLGVQVPNESLATVSALSTLFSTGQLAVTASALALGSTTNYRNGFALSCLSTSSASVFIGTASVTVSNGFELIPSQSIIIPVANIATIYIIAASISTSTVSWIGFN